MIAVSVSYFDFVTFLVHLTKLTVLCFYTINPDWCGIHGCAGCGSSIGHLVQEALDALPSKQEPLTSQSIDGEETVLANENYDHEKEIVVEDVNSKEGGSFMVTNDAYLGPQNSAVGSGEQTQQVVQRLPFDDDSNLVGSPFGHQCPVEIVVEDVDSCCGSVCSRENDQRPKEGEPFMVPNDAYFSLSLSLSQSDVVDQLPSDDTSLGMCDVTCW